MQKILKHNFPHKLISMQEDNFGNFCFTTSENVKLHVITAKPNEKES